MIFARRLTHAAASAGRTALGTVLGLTLAGAVAFQPNATWAQTAAPAAAAREVPRAEGAGPALWVVRDADSTIYLFGTVHVLRPTTAWGTDRVDQAFESADEIWFEISNPDDAAAMMPLIQQYGISPQRPLSSLLTAEEMTELNAAATGIGMPAGQVDMLRPWFAALTLSIAPLVKAGYDPQSGVELVLKSRAQAAGKPIKAFETIDSQIRILAELPEEEQLAFLRSTLEDYENAHVMVDAMVSDWSRGDVEALDRTIVQEMKTDSQVVYDAMLTNRNTNWANQIQQILAGSGTAFIAVGAAHLAGDDSVQSILAQRGVTAERVE